MNSIFPVSNNLSLCIFSDENRKNLDNVKSDCYIFAEYGLYFLSKRDQPEVWTKTDSCSASHPISNWSEQLLNILKYYSERVPNSKIEVLDVKFRLFFIVF